MKKVIKSRKVGDLKAESLIKLYLCLYGIFAVFFIAIAIATHGEALAYAFFHGNDADLFMDFFNSVRDANSTDVYQKEVIYPPLSNLIFMALSSLMNEENVKTSFAHRRELRNNDDTGMMVYLVFVVICLLIIIKSLSVILSEKKINASISQLFIFTAVFSYPVLYCIQRGNILLLCFALTLVFFAYKDSETAWKRNLAYISLAVAAGLKIYPAIFGLTLIFEKKYKQAVKLAVFGVLFFFVPFAFYGGFEGIRQLYKNITSFSGIRGEYFQLGNTSAGNLALLNAPKLSKAISVFTLISAFFMVLFVKDVKRKVFLMCYIMANISSASAMYILMFFIIPFVMELASTDKRTISDRVIMILTGLMLVMLPCFYVTHVVDAAHSAMEMFNLSSYKTERVAMWLCSVNMVLSPVLVQGIYIVSFVEFMIDTVKEIIRLDKIKT